MSDSANMPMAAPPPAPMRSAQMAKVAEAETRERADEQQAVAEVSGFQVMFKIPGRVSLAANEG
ncbi:hypothetical protein ABTO80_18320, partial [Acinetobacter baumannii]